MGTLLIWIPRCNARSSGFEKGFYKLAPVFTFEFLKNVFSRYTAVSQQLDINRIHIQLVFLLGDKPNRFIRFQMVTRVTPRILAASD